MAPKDDAIYQLKVTLDHVKPPVWRRLLVPASIELPALHCVLQAAMGWQDSHLHAFRTGRTQYLDPDPDAGMVLNGERSERRVALRALLRAPRQKLAYEYDFGDGWEHTILLEKIAARQPDTDYPVCIAAAGACPPEDCGGPFGYMDLIDIMADPTHERHAELRDWLGGVFEPDKVELADINAAMPRTRKRRQGACTRGE